MQNSSSPNCMKLEFLSGNVTHGSIKGFFAGFFFGGGEGIRVVDWVFGYIFLKPKTEESFVSITQRLSSKKISNLISFSLSLSIKCIYGKGKNSVKKRKEIFF